jgi:serine/threonine-protein kinase
MTPDLGDSQPPRSARHLRAKELFLSACELTGAERERYLLEACGDDAALREEVRSLLALDAVTGGDFFRGMPEPAHGLDDIEQGARLGGERSYRLIELLGEGGMGRVFLAERADGEFHQKVAIKLLSWSLGADAAAARRFRAERQILARLTHPNIARLLDGGTTAQGQPFLVMEHIVGEPIDVYVERRAMPLADRLRLFLRVCDAVRLAHQNLVVHRDLKPANILVTADGEPRLLDFGIAKLLDPEAAGEGAETRRGENPLTPRYASPEQVRGEGITTGSDIYSLGVILYELVAGRGPYTVPLTSAAALVRAICETQPAPPSTVRLEATGRALHRVGRDLDEIVLKALRKEPADRYASVEALVEDIERLLDGKPVAARRGGRSYRLGRFARRHRWWLAAAALFLLTVAGFVASLERQLRETARQRDSAARERDRAARERDSAARERDRATAATDFMLGLFSAADPAVAKGEEITARQLVDQGAARIDEELAGQPDLRATMLDSLGRVYRHLGDPERGVPLLEKALALRRQIDKVPSESLYLALHHLGLARLEASRLDEAEALLVEALALRGRFTPSAGVDFAAALNDLAMVHNQRGDLDESVRLMGQVVEEKRRRWGVGHEKVAIAQLNLASVYFRQGDMGRAEAACREAVELLRKVYPGDHPDLAFALSNLAAATDDNERALPILEEALAMRRRLLGDRHPDVGVGINNLAVTLYWMGDYRRAEPLLREALAIWIASYGEQAAVTASVEHNLGQVLLDRGEPAAARPWFEKALAVREKRNRPRDPDLAQNRTTLGQTLCELGEAKRGEALVRSGIAVQQEVLAEDSRWRVNLASLRLARCVALSGRTDEAAALGRENLPVMRKRLGPTHPLVIRFESSLPGGRPGNETAPRSPSG